MVSSLLLKDIWYFCEMLLWKIVWITDHNYHNLLTIIKLGTSDENNIGADATTNIVPQRRRYAHAAEVLLSDLLVVSEEVAANWLLQKPGFEKIMGESTFTKKMTKCLHELGIYTKKARLWAYCCSCNYGYGRSLWVGSEEYWKLGRRCFSE